MKVNIAVIGCGIWGENIARNASELGVLACVCDAHRDRAISFSQKFSCPAFSFDQILNDNTLNGVIIATDANTHEKLACEALNARKHVYVEKPLALSMSSALSIKQCAINTNKQVMVGHLLQYHPAYVELKNFVNDGFIGELQHIQATRLAMGRIKKSESALFDLCPHDISQILGIVREVPTSINCRNATHVEHSDGDIIFTSLKFPNGVTAIMHSSWYSPYKEHRLVVTGSLGSIIFDDTKPSQQKLTFFRDSIIIEGDAIKVDRAEPEHLPFCTGEPLKNEISAFIEVCKNGHPAITDIEEGLKVQQILSEMKTQIDSELL